MAVLACNNLYKSYIVDTVLEDISFTVEEKDKVGLIGQNGSGKTTLFNILAGKLEKDKGDIYLQKTCKLGYLMQNVHIQSHKTIFHECLDVFSNLIRMEDEIKLLESDISVEGSKGDSPRLSKLMDKYSQLIDDFSSLNGYGYKSEIRGVLIGLGFLEEDFEKPVNLLSGGQKARLSLAKLLLEKPNILLLDEPTNHLDIGAIDWLEKFIRDYNGACVIISHDRYFLDNTVNKVFFLENKKLSIYNTNYTQFIKRRKQEIEVKKKQFEDQQKDLKRQEEIIQRFMNYGGARDIKQAQSRQKLLDKIKVLDKPETGKKTNLKFTPSNLSGVDVLSIKDLSKAYDKRIFSNVSLNIYRGEKVALIGENGVGKTSLFKMILGKLDYDQGEIKLGQQVFPAYFDQEMSTLKEDNTVIDELWDSFPKLNYKEIRNLLSQFLFIGEDIFKEVSDLSGGEKGRLSLLKLMLSKSNFLLMDEPTNHLDMDSKEVLEDAILNYEGSIFVISHDRYFLNKIASKVVELQQDGISEYLGNYDYYLEKKRELGQVHLEDDGEEKTRTQIKLEKKKQRDLEIEEREKKRTIVKLEGQIQNLELSLEDIDHKLCDPEFYENPQEVLKLSTERDNLSSKLEGLYDKWLLLKE